MANKSDGSSQPLGVGGVTSYFGEYAGILHADVKAYLCDVDAVHQDLDCDGRCGFWVERGACAVLTEVCG